MPQSASNFREKAIASGLITEQQLAESMAEIMSSKGKSAEDISDKRLAKQLVKKKIVTAYQADQLLTGRTRLNLGPYIITDWIGQGGMGQVFKCVHEMLGRESAIKVLPLHKTTPDAIENFRREIRAQAKLDHPNLVRAFDAGEDGNVHYLVVEYIPGTDLRRLVRTKGRLSVQQAANIVKQAAEGLMHAHEKNLIHRDIKPGNILVTPDGIAKLSDLGLAFHLNDPNDPRVGKIVGTADYLSPEQIRAPLSVTYLSDIYSLGCTLYYAVTGKVPFPGGTPKSKAQRHLHETPWHPRRFNDEVSDDFVDLIGDMMEKNPAERIQSAAEVAERLLPWASDNSPLLTEDFDQKSRWQSAPVQAVDMQDTDPNLDVAEMAMSEISDATGNSQGTASLNDPSADTADTGSFTTITGKPPVPTTMVEQYNSAGRLDKTEPHFSVTTLFLVGFVSLVVGILIGFVIGFYVG